jgi:hypothetical protein
LANVRCLKVCGFLFFHFTFNSCVIIGLYLLAFGPLRRVFSASELNDIGDVMAERSIRLRKGLDEAVEDWKEVSESEMENGSELDEIEYNARELKRLKPY